MRTYRLLLGHAMTLVKRGRIPSVPELAVNEARRTMGPLVLLP